MRFTKLFAGLTAILATASGAAHGGTVDDEPGSAGPFSFSANVTIATDYRFRGISQTENNFALQGGFDATHESGFYVGTWASNLSGWGTFEGANTELDLYGGYTTEIGDLTVDGGVIWYLFPQGLDRTSYGEFFGSIGKSFGAVDVTVGANYAFAQDALSLNNDNEDNIYIYSDAGFDIAATPFSISAHIGYSDGNAGAGPNGWVASPTGTFFDWSLGISAKLPWGPLSVSATYIDTNITRSEASSFQLINPGYRFGIGRATGVFAITAAF